jgi:CTP:molybdopterin cytidylyltransferase MocA
MLPPPTLDRCIGVILAAGEGRRFGGAKQLAMLDGRPLLQHVIETARSTPRLEEVVVVLGAHRHEIRARVDLSACLPVTNLAWPGGPTESLRCGLSAALELRATSVVLLLGDQPRMKSTVITAVLESRGSLARARYRSGPGHPIAAHGPMISRLRDAPDTGARRALIDQEARVVDVLDDDVGVDVDRPEDLRALQGMAG